MHIIVTEKKYGWQYLEISIHKYKNKKSKMIFNLIKKIILQKLKLIKSLKYIKIILNYS